MICDVINGDLHEFHVKKKEFYDIFGQLKELRPWSYNEILYIHSFVRNIENVVGV